MQLPFAKHVSEEQWIDFLDGETTAAVNAQIQAHLDSGCRDCAARLEEWRRLVGALERGRTVEDIPAAVLENAFGLFEREAPRPTALLEQITAFLAFDSRSQPLLAGARSAGALSFNLVFEASDTTIYLWCERDSVRWQVRGQVLPADTSWSLAVNGGQQAIPVAPEEDGEFYLPDLMPGKYDLLLRDSRREIRVPSVILDTP